MVGFCHSSRCQATHSKSVAYHTFTNRHDSASDPASSSCELREPWNTVADHEAVSLSPLTARVTSKNLSLLLPLDTGMMVSDESERILVIFSL